MNLQGAILVFAKSPVTGQVKTRLIPDMGCDRATSLYKELLSRTLKTVINTGISNIQLWIKGDIHHPYFTDLENRDNFEFYSQTGKDLGERMFNAFESALDKYSRAVLIGSDCPELLSSDIRSAMNFLENGKDLVLGPAEDGGYYLIGLRKNNIKLFSGIHWGKDNVFSETCSIANQLNLDTVFLEKRSDLDRVSDLDSYYRLKREEVVL